MLARSDLLDVRPFRWAWGRFLGLMTLLGKDSGGWIGLALGGLLAGLIGDTGAAIVGGTLLLGGALLVSGASTGRSCAAPATSSARPAPRRAAPRLAVARVADGGVVRPRLGAGGAAPRRLLDGAEAFLDVVGEPLSARRRHSFHLHSRRAGHGEPHERLRDVGHADYRLGPHSPPALARRRRVERGRGRADRRPPRPHARRVRRGGDGLRPDLRPARDALRAAARARDEGLEGRRAPRRPLLRARDDGDQDPRSDPGQAGGRRRGPEPVAASRHARRHLRRPPADGEPARRVARQGHLRERRLDRTSHAAPPDRGDDRVGQVGLHQHDPHLDALRCDAGRGA